MASTGARPLPPATISIGASAVRSQKSPIGPSTLTVWPTNACAWMCDEKAPPGTLRTKKLTWASGCMRVAKE